MRHVEESHREIIKFFANVPDKDGYLPIFYAVKKGDVKAVNFWAQFTENKNVTVCYGFTLLHMAAAKSDLHCSYDPSYEDETA